jgi:hypothetical protein
VQSAAADVLDYLESARAPKVDLITANLFLHHFPAAPLVRLLAGVARHTDRFVACETLRRPIALLASQMVWAAGCSADTRNDAVLSVRAGFDGRELSELWPEREGWELNERRVLLTHRFAARRVAP